MTPRLSVVMAVLDGARYLEEAAQSILGQTFRDFEFIIVDDASTDATPDLLATLALRDRRIRVIRNDVHAGLPRSLNRALDLARAPIIARMDADDVSVAHRLERQVAFLDTHPDHLLIGGGYRSIDAEGRPHHAKQESLDDVAARWLMRFRMCFIHPSICFRRSLPDGTPVRYDEGYPVAQDYDLCAGLMAHGKAAILPEVMLKYRTHTANVTSNRFKLQMQWGREIAQRVRTCHLPDDLQEGWEIFADCYFQRKPATPDGLTAAVAAFDRMLAHDIACHPSRAAWFRRQSAALLAEAFLRRGGGGRRPLFVARYLWAARRYGWPLLMRVGEQRGWPVLRSQPDLA